MFTKMLMIRINKTQEILIVFDDIIADMFSNNSAELFFVVKSQVFLFLFFFITQSYCGIKTIYILVLILQASLR